MLTWLWIILATINLNFNHLKEDPKRYWWSTVVRFISACFFIGIVLCYWILPTYYWPNIFWIIFWVIAHNAIYTLIGSVYRASYDYSGSLDQDNFWENIPARIFSIAMLGLMLIAFVIFISPYFDVKGNFRELPKIQMADQLPAEEIEKLDVNHMLLVPPEMAGWKAKQVLGAGGKNYGSLYNVGKLELQKIDGRLMYAAPLEYNGFFEWRNARTSPGFVLVDAEDPNAPVKLIELDEGKRMRYLPSAFWGENLRRYIYNHGYKSYTQYENTFEVDEEFHPYFVVSLTRKTAGFEGHELKKVLIVNPITGTIEDYNPETHFWADRIFPENLAKTYADYWGLWVNGYWNTWLSKKDIQESVGRVMLVYGSSENPDFFIQMTSHSGADNALVGYFLFNSHKNEATYFKVDGGFGHSEAVKDIIEAKEEVAKPRYHCDWMTFYPNVYGEMTWVAPVISPSHLVEMVSLVHAPNSTSSKAIALGNIKDDALDAYIELLASIKADNIEKVPTDQALLFNVTDVVDRIAYEPVIGGNRYYIEVSGYQNIIFQIPPELANADLVLTKPGDSVALEVLDTKEGVLSVRKFSNDRYENIRISPEQRQYNEEVRQNRQNEKEYQEYLQLKEQQKRFDQLKKKFD